jgi:hypothetical protein
MNDPFFKNSANPSLSLLEHQILRCAQDDGSEGLWMTILQPT